MARIGDIGINIRAYDANGDPVSGAELLVHLAGTTTPVTIYSDRALTTPVSPSSNAAGAFAACHVAPGVYKIDIVASGSSLPGFPVDDVVVGNESLGDLRLTQAAHSAAIINTAGTHEGAINRWMHGAQAPYAFLGNPEAHKDYVKWMGVSEAQNALELERYFNTVAGFMGEDIGDRVPQAIVAGARLIRDAINGTIIQDNGDKWALTGISNFENRAQFLAFDTAIKAANGSTFTDGDTLGWPGHQVTFVTGNTVMADAAGWVPVGGRWGIEVFKDNAAPGATDMTAAFLACWRHAAALNGSASTAAEVSFHLNGKRCLVSEPTLVGLIDANQDGTPELGTGAIHNVTLEAGGTLVADTSGDWTDVVTSGGNTVIPGQMLVIADLRNADHDGEYRVSGIKVLCNFDCAYVTGSVYFENANNCTAFGGRYHRLGVQRSHIHTSTGSPSGSRNVLGWQTYNGNLHLENLEIRGAKREAGEGYNTDTLPSGPRDGICTFQTAGGAGNLTLNGSLVSGGTATAPVHAAGVSFPVEIHGAVGNDLRAVTFTITGTDAADAPLVEAVAGPDCVDKGRHVQSSGRFKTVSQVAVDAAVGSNVEIGFCMGNVGLMLGTADAFTDGLNFSDLSDAAILHGHFNGDHFGWHPWSRRVTIEADCHGMSFSGLYMDYTDLVLHSFDHRIDGVSQKGGKPSIIMVASAANEDGEGLSVPFPSIRAGGGDFLRLYTEGSGTWADERNRKYNIGPLDADDEILLNFGGMMVVDKNGNTFLRKVQAGPSGTLLALDWNTRPNVQAVDTGGGAAVAAVRASDTAGADMLVARMRGTDLSANTALQSGDEIGGLKWIAADGTDLDNTAASIVAVTTQNHTALNKGTSIVMRAALQGNSAQTDLLETTQAGFVQFNIGAALPPVTVANLPSVAASPGARCTVSDSTVAASGNFGAVVTGGGANTVPVYSDGTNWRIG